MKKRSLFLLLLGVMLIAASPFAGTNAYADGDAPQTVQEGADSAGVQVEVPEIVQGVAGADPAESIEQAQEVRGGADSSEAVMKCSTVNELVNSYTAAEREILQQFGFVPLFYKSSYLVAKDDNEDILYDPFTGSVDYRIARNYS